MKNSKKIYFGLLLVIVFLISTMYFSYAFFTSKNEEHGKLNIVAGTLDYKIESKDLENNQITIKANSIKKITIKLKSLNEIDSKYELFYETTNNDIEVGYTGDILPIGTINANSSKEIEVFLSNTSNTNITVTFSCEGGFTHNSLVKSKGISIPAQTSICENYTTHVWNYDYTGDVQDFVSPCDGIYTMETWGASGGISASYPTNDVGQGKGAYTKGNINLTSKQNIYIYVGKEGISTSYAYLTKEYEFNGGGYANVRPFDTTGDNLSSGGGATDIRINNGNWDNFASLKSRIMVASAGAGGSYDGSEPGAGGGLVGYNGIQATSNWWASLDAGYGATQTEPGQLSGDNYLIIGGFGYGGTSSGGGHGGGAGGSGWYGGSGGYVQSGGGGSSFISGHNGCVAIQESSTEDNIIQRSDINNETCTDGTTDITCSYHYSDYIFTDTVMIDGAGYKWTTEKGDVVVGMPTHDGTSTMIGNTGNGYAKITYLGKSTNIEDLLEYKLESDDLENNQITLAANTMKKVTVDVNSLSKISSNYELYYTTDDSTDLIVGYGDQNNETTGIIGTNTTKTVDIYIRNTSNESKIINFGIKGNILYNDISLEATEKNINDLCIVNKVYNFDYIENEENFIAPCSGTYKLEVWGAQGGSNINVIGGYGGYSIGDTNLSKDEILYTNIGGSGLGSYETLSELDNDIALHLDGGYNGGGIGSAGICTNTRYAASGGGATHISKTSGLLSKLENSKDKILIAAGGGGGSFEMGESLSHGTYGDGSSAGGYMGNTAIFTNVTHTKTYYATGGTQTSGGIGGNSYIDSTVQHIGTFGQGGGYKATGTCTEVSGGGGGYYGGGLGSWAPGAGGSGYIGNSLLTDKTMYCYECNESEDESTKTISTINVSEDAISNYAKKGNGYAKITYLGKEE